MWEHKGGEGRWKNLVNSETGESSIKEHELKTIWTSCLPKEHHFELTNSAQREVTCSRCGFLTHFVLGIQKLQDGKLVNLR